MCNGSPSLYWAVSGLIVLPIVPWCLTKHREAQKARPSWKSLYYLSIALYIFTIFGSLCSFFVGILACNQGMIWYVSWYLYRMGWTNGSCCLVGILYARVYYVFRGSIYSLSNCTHYAFIIMYGILIIDILFGYITLVINPKLFGFILMFGMILILFLVNYLSFLFIYKLIQISKTVSSSMPSAEPSSTGTAISSSISSNQSSKYNNVITKSTVLTIFSLISTWILFICSVFMSMDTTNYILNSVWYFALGMDINTNFLCAMFSNSFADKYYIYFLGSIDHCFRSKKQENINSDVSSQQTIETTIE